LIADAVEAILGMMGQDQLQDGSSSFMNGGGIGFYNHAFPNGSGACCLQKAHTFHFANTNTAVCFNSLVRVIAKGRNFYSGNFCCLQNSYIFRDGDFNAIYHYICHK